MSDVILQAYGVHKTYYLGQAAVQVLKGASLSIHQGEFVAVMGASGSGKSTLLHLLGALDIPDRGTVTFQQTDLFANCRPPRAPRTPAQSRLGSLARRGLQTIGTPLYLVAYPGLILLKLLHLLVDRSSDRRDHHRNVHFGFVFQFYHLLPELNTLENVLLPAMVCNSVPRWLAVRGRTVARARELLKWLGLDHRLRHRPNELSGGERQRVAIARALINQPQVLLADEPTGNLDAKTGAGILELLQKLNRQGQTIVMVTHDPKVASAADRVVTLEDGRILARGA